VEPRGRLLGNRYELLVPLASGGMGRVWRARDTRLERPVAVKLLRSEFTGDPTFRARFRAEAQHTAALHHPNIASVTDYGEVEEDGERLAYLVMELVEGETLAALMQREGRLGAARTLDLLQQASAALAAAHAAGLVHRDVKPGNVLLGTDGIVKITDFGIAWSASSVPLTATGQVIGTAQYLSPEQAAGGKATAASDVYSLGTVAYECLTGRRAFDGENSVQVAVKQIREEPAPLPPDVPAAVRALVERAMAKDPAQRFPDGAALHAAVQAVQDASATAPIDVAGPHGTAVLTLPPLRSAPAAPPARRLPIPLLLGAIAAVVAVAVLIAALRPDPGGTTATPPVSEQPTTAQETTPPPAPATVGVDAAEFLGRPVAEVYAELFDRGLQVEIVQVVTAEVDAGAVAAVAPEGELSLGTVVTVSYAVPPLPVPDPADGADNGDQGNGNNGNGNGRGNGRGNDRND